MTHRPSTPVRSHRGPRTIAACGALLALLACEDATMDPFARLVAEETSAALALGVELPDPGSWTVPEAASAEQVDAVGRWLTSWDSPQLEGRSARDRTYATLAELFGSSFERGRIAEEADRLFEAVRRAGKLSDEGLPERIRTGIDQAARYHREAALAVRDDRLQAALEHVLRGADALREVGPEAVARTLVTEVEVEAGRVSPDDPYSEKDLERLDRLIRGGREAIRDQDWVLAIRRAYYARGLLAQAGS